MHGLLGAFYDYGSADYMCCSSDVEKQVLAFYWSCEDWWTFKVMLEVFESCVGLFGPSELLLPLKELEET